MLHVAWHGCCRVASAPWRERKPTNPRPRERRLIHEGGAQVERVNNHFALVILAASRARQIAVGAPRLVECTNKSAVAALREVGAGKVRFKENVDATIRTFVAERKEVDRVNKLAGTTRRHRDRQITTPAR
jgi:DNA-directed RNA polymerase omega subunit